MKLIRLDLGRAIAQAVSRWLRTAAARVPARVRSCGIFGGPSSTGPGFLLVLRFPLPIFVPPIVRQSPSSIIWGWYNRREVDAVPSGLSQSHPNKNNNNSLNLFIFRHFCLVSSKAEGKILTCCAEILAVNCN
jgi:hypothetical protein